MPAPSSTHGQRVHRFVGGIVVVSGRGQPITYARLDREGAERTETAPVSQGQQQSRYDVLEPCVAFTLARQPLCGPGVD